MHCYDLMRLLIFSLIAFVTGCATQAIVGTVAEGEQATVLGHIDRSEGFYHWRSYSVLRVDEKQIDHAPFSNPYETVVRVSPGKRNVLALVRFHTGLYGSGTYEAVAFLPALSLERGRTYRVNGEQRGDRYAVWLEESPNNSRVSDEVVVAHSREQRPASIYVPILIPAK